MRKVNEELIGKDSVKKKATFLPSSGGAEVGSAQTFVTDEPQDEGEGSSQRMLDANGEGPRRAHLRSEVGERARTSLAYDEEKLSRRTRSQFEGKSPDSQDSDSSLYADDLSRRDTNAEQSENPVTPTTEGRTESRGSHIKTGSNGVNLSFDDEDNLEGPSSHPEGFRDAQQGFQSEEDEDIKLSEDITEQVGYSDQPAAAAAQADRRRRANRSEETTGIKPAPSEPQSWMENLELILDIPLQIDVQLGQTKMPLKEVLELSSGSIIKLNKSESDPVELLINGKLVAEGQIVLTDKNTLGIQVTSIVNRVERIRSLR